MNKTWRGWRESEQGASVVEYALLVALIAIVCIVAIAFFGGALSENISGSASEIPGPGS